jgi:hypothetical protein
MAAQVGAAGEDGLLEGIGFFQPGAEAGQVHETIGGVAQLAGHHALGADQGDRQAPCPQHLHEPIQVAAATEQPQLIGAMGHGHQIDGDLHVQIGPDVVPLFRFGAGTRGTGRSPTGAHFPQGLGAHREAQAGEGIAKRTLISGFLQPRVPEGTGEMDLGTVGGEFEQAAWIEEPAHLLLGIEHAVAVDRQDALHRLIGSGLGDRA